MDRADGIVGRLQGLPNQDKLLVKLVLKGAVPVDLLDGVKSIPAQTEGLGFIEVDQAGLHIKPSIDELLPSMQGKASQETMKTLLLLLSRHPSLEVETPLDPEESEERLRQLVDVGKVLDAEPRVLERAVERLFLLSKEVER